MAGCVEGKWAAQVVGSAGRKNGERKGNRGKEDEEMGTGVLAQVVEGVVG